MPSACLLSSFPKRRMSAAALSAAVDSRKPIRSLAPHTGGTNSEEVPNSNAIRSSGGSAREGLLSEKPPPSHILVFVILFGRGGLGERRFSQRSGLSPRNFPA